MPVNIGALLCIQQCFLSSLFVGVLLLARAIYDSQRRWLSFGYAILGIAITLVLGVLLALIVGPVINRHRRRWNTISLPRRRGLGRVYTAEEKGKSATIATIGKTVRDFAQNLIRVTEEGCKLLINPQSTKADEQKWWEDVKNVVGQGTHDVGGEAASNAKEHVTKHLMDGGMNKADAEKLFERRWKQIIDLAEKVRKDIPKIEETAKLGWLKFVGGITALLSWRCNCRHGQRSIVSTKSDV